MLPTVAQYEAIKQFFESKSLDLKCCVCDSDDWAVEDIIPPPEVEGPQILLRGAMVPLVQFECRDCGHIVFFNAITLGLYRAAPDAASH